MTPEPAQPAESPEARVSVPLVPTEAMYEAAAQAWKGPLSTYWAREMWDAMVAASPPGTTSAATTARLTERGAVEGECGGGAIIYAAAILETHADKLPVPSHIRSLAARCRLAAKRLAALTPPVTVAATDQADRDRRMYEQGRKDALSGEPEAFI